jgi:hypothetical protein
MHLIAEPPNIGVLEPIFSFLENFFPLITKIVYRPEDTLAVKQGYC